MRAVAAACLGQRFYIKGVPYRSFLSYDRPAHNGAAYSRLMNGDSYGQGITVIAISAMEQRSLP